MYLYTDSWMVPNVLRWWLQQWKKTKWQHRGKPIWAAVLGQDITAQVEDMTLNVTHVDAHVPKSHTTEQHQNILGHASRFSVGMNQLNQRINMTLGRLTQLVGVRGHQEEHKM